MYLVLFELCYTDLIKAVCLSTEAKQIKLNGPVGQISVGPRCCSGRRINKELYEVNPLVAIPPSVAYSKENCWSYWSSTTVLNFRYKELTTVLNFRYKELTTCLQMEELRENYEHLLTGCKRLYLNFCLTSKT